jgi:hypothetical protein
MKTRVLDSWAILKWMNNRQPASNRVDTLLTEAEAARTGSDERYRCGRSFLLPN